MPSSESVGTSTPVEQVRYTYTGAGARETVTDANGNALTTLVAGVRVRKKNQRKITIFSLTPIFGPEE